MGSNKITSEKGWIKTTDQKVLGLNPNRVTSETKMKNPRATAQGFFRFEDTSRACGSGEWPKNEKMPRRRRGRFFIFVLDLGLT